MSNKRAESTKGLIVNDYDHVLPELSVPLYIQSLSGAAREEAETYMYSRHGNDRRGFDCQGIHEFTGTNFDSDGDHYVTGNEFDEDGYNEEGYDEDGFDREGFDSKGFDREGYDEDEYHREGYRKQSIEE